MESKIAIFLHRQKINIQPWLVFATAVFLTILAAYTAHLRQAKYFNDRLDRAELRIQHTIEDKIEGYVNTLIHTRSFLMAVPHVSRKQFRSYITAMTLSSDYSGILGVSFITLIPQDHLNSHIQQVRREGFPTYNIWPKRPQLPSDQQYTSVVYIEPFDEINQRAFGFDMMAEPIRRQAMEKARDSGRPSATSKLVLVQDNPPGSSVERPFGFIIFVPIYKIGMPIATIDQRQMALQGFVASSIRSEAFNQILKNENLLDESVTFEIFAGPTSDEKNLFFRPFKKIENLGGQIETARTIPLSVINQNWNLRIYPLPGFDELATSDTPWEILLFGISVSFLLYLFVRLATRYGWEIAASENQLRLITDTLPVLISYVDSKEIYRFANKAYSEWFAAGDEAIAGKPIYRILGKDAYLATDAFRRKALNGENISYETELVHKDKGLRKMFGQYLPDIREDGKVHGITVLATDVTEQRRAEEKLREQTRTLEIINQVGLSLQVELELQKIVQTVTDSATELTNAKFGAFFYNVKNEKNETMTLFTISGVPRQEFSKFPLPRKTKIFGATLDNHTIVRSDDITKHPDFGKNSPFHGMPDGHLPVRSYLAVPVISRSGEVLGGLFFGHPEVGIFNERSEKLVAGIAAQAAVAIDNANLYSALKISDQRSKELAKSQTFLAEAGQILSSSLDSKTILSNVTKIVVPTMADWCSVHLVEPDGTLVQLAVAHADPEKVKWAEELNRKYPTRMNPESGASKVVRTGQSQLVMNISDSMLQRVAVDPEHLQILRNLGLSSYIIVPLRTRERVFGTISFIATDSGKKFNQEDLHFAEDLARRASVAVENAKLYGEAQAINRIKDEFLATLSHELRTPLNVILGHAEILKTEAPSLGEDLDTSIDAIFRNAKVQNQIIGDLLDVSAIITGKISFNPTILDPGDVAKTAVESIRFAALSKGVKLTLVPDGHHCYISGDPVRLQQVVWNLLSNAVKFTPKGGEVTVTTFGENSCCNIEVRDTGQGIEPNFLPYVFDRFRQEDSSMTRKFGGLGLGLSIVRQLVELHGGTINVESRGKGQGSSFRVSLPVAAAHHQDSDLAAATGNSAGAVQKSKTPANLQGIKVLVIDDEPDARELIGKILQKAGATVSKTGSAKEAFEGYKAYKPDVIISDLGMPEEDGFSFMRRLRTYESDNGQFTPAAALSAYAREEDRKKALAAGYQVHLSKPVDSKQLVQSVADLARLH
jgi:PAS domain S-box-containing protein